MMEKVIVTRAFVGICHMQVCAEKDATDEEILQVCNTENPSGTFNGWCEVVRHVKEKEEEKMLPIQCSDYPERLHFMVAC